MKQRESVGWRGEERGKERTSPNQEERRRRRRRNRRSRRRRWEELTCNKNLTVLAIWR